MAIAPQYFPSRRESTLDFLAPDRSPGPRPTAEQERQIRAEMRRGIEEMQTAHNSRLTPEERQQYARLQERRFRALPNPSAAQATRPLAVTQGGTVLLTPDVARTQRVAEMFRARPNPPEAQGPALGDLEQLLREMAEERRIARLNAPHPIATAQEAGLPTYEEVMQCKLAEGSPPTYEELFRQQNG